jgi:alkylated DNA nucleotide flippase Atl1
VKPVRGLSEVWASFYRIVRRIPRGRVATYAQVAMLAGRPRSARHVGYALAALLEREGVEFDARERVSLERYGWRPRPRRA